MRHRIHERLIGRQDLNSMSPSTADLDVSIVIVSWNTRELLERCLASVFAGLGRAPSDLSEGGLPTGEVVVVDNNSRDGSAELVRERYPRARLIASRENLGFARANNLGLRGYRGRYALLLNPDTEVQPGALARLVRYLDAHPDVGAAGPLILNPDGSLQLSCHRSPNLPRELWRLFHGDAIRHFGTYAMDEWSRHEPRAVDVIQGACLMVRREALTRVGLLDEDFYIYSEEVDLCERIRREGWAIHWVPEAAVVHYGGQSTRQVAEEMFLHLYRSKLIYFRKHQGAFAARAYKAILYLASLARLALGPLAEAAGRRDRAERQLVVRHYQRLIRELPGL